MQIVTSEFGKIDENGNLKIYNRDEFVNKIKTFPKQSVEIVVIKREGSFTHQQRKYYFSVIVPEMRKAFLYHGNQLSKSETDTKLRELFLYDEEYDSITDTYSKKICRLSDEESTVGFDRFKVFMENCIRFGAQMLDWAIPYPNELFSTKDYTESQIMSINSKFK